jgi:hypothetical protein
MSLYTDHKPESLNRRTPTPDHTQTPAAPNGWGAPVQQAAGDSRQPQKRHTPISGATGRLTYAAGWSTGKVITFDAAI